MGDIPTYDSLRQEVQSAQQQQPPGQQQPQFPSQDFAPLQRFTPPGQDLAYAQNQAGYQQHQFQSAPEYGYEPISAPPPPPPPPPPRHVTYIRKRKSLMSLETVKDKRVWLLAVVIFALVYWGIPRIKAAVPSVVSPATGRMTTLGLAGVSFVTALSFTLASELI